MSGGGMGMSHREFFGGLLKWIGWVIMALSGMCTFGVVVSSLGEVFKMLVHGRVLEVFEAALLPLIVGGLPFLVGWGFWALGQKILGPPPGEESLPKETSVPSSKETE